MKLKKLTLEHFKGIDHFELEPEGRDMDVYGNNGSGKTTLADAYFWLLLGKDSAGRSDSNFDVIPRGSSGLDCAVEGEFLKDGDECFTLRRVYKQVFTRKNGEAEREYKGNTTDFFIDGVPKPKKDYTAYVASLCDEKMLALLTDPDYFAGKMHWDERRDMLLRFFAPDVDEDGIINRHKELAPLLHYKGYKTVDDYIAVSREQRKKINRELDSIPQRIDEAEKAKPHGVAPLPTDGARLGALTVEQGRIERRIASLRNGEVTVQRRKEIAELEANMAQAEARFYRTMQIPEAVKDLEILNRERRRIESQLEDLQRRQAADIPCLNTFDAQLNELRAACQENFMRQFEEGSGVCPTCGQSFPPEKLEELRAAWNEEKAERQQALESQGKALKQKREELAQSISRTEQRLLEKKRDLDECNARARVLEKETQQVPEWTNTAEYAAISAQLEDKRRSLAAAEDSASILIEKETGQLQAVKAELEEIRGRMAADSLMDQQNKRIAELKQQEKCLASHLADIDNGLHLADQFIQTKATDIEEQVNAAFKLVRWKLFDKQINGGIKPCCEATVDGIEYGTNLNSAARLNAGLDIIGTLSGQLGTSFPVWIDNAESVTSYLPMEAQVIRLYVSESDEKLRTEVRK